MSDNVKKARVDLLNAQKCLESMEGFDVTQVRLKATIASLDYVVRRQNKPDKEAAKAAKKEERRKARIVKLQEKLAELNKED